MLAGPLLAAQQGGLPWCAVAGAEACEGSCRGCREAVKAGLVCVWPCAGAGRPSASTRIRGGISASKRARGAQCCKRAKADRRKKARDKGGRPHAQASLGTRWIPTSSRCRCSWARSNAFSSRTLCSLSTPLSIAPAFISSLALVVCALARPFCARDTRGGVHTSSLMWHARER